MRLSFETFVNVALLAAATIVTSAVLRRPHEVDPSQRSEPLPSPVENWREVAAVGVPYGDADAAVTVTVFSDFECPYCRAFHQTLLRARHLEPAPIRLAISFIHFPLSYHRFALPAARAAECAADQARFEAFADEVFERQDSLGLLSWQAFAERARVPSMSLFASCIEAVTERARIGAGVAAANRLEVQGTPTVLVNQWRLSNAPTVEQLQAIVAAVANGRAPLGARSK